MRPIAITLLAIGYFLGSAVAKTEAPPLGWTTQCKVVRVKDGDTVRVEVRRVIDVRLLDVWAPELSEPGGQESKDHLIELLDGSDVVLHIPGSDREEVGDVWTFSRAIGVLYCDGGNVNRQMVRDGYATKDKQ